MIAFGIGKTYSFNTRSPAFLGARIERAKLNSIGDVDLARRFSAVDLTHAQVYPSLPEGTPNDPAATDYLIFTAMNGSKVVLARTWIDEDSVEEVSYVSIRVDLPRCNLTDVETIRVALTAAGVSDFKISVT